MTTGRIYLDYNATTPVDPRVVQAMLPWFSEHFGNAASSTHGMGCDAAGGIEAARADIATTINAQAKDIIFTSGATESINLALIGMARQYQERGRHIITCATEHRATLETCEYLQTQGFSLTVLPVDATGQLSLDEFKNALRPDTIFVSIMAANNEIGTLHDIAAIGRVAREKGIFLHVDAAQAYGKIPLDVEVLSVDLMSLSAHKCYGPKGVGALYLRRREPRVRLQPLLFGGGHERGLRAGTLNVPGIMGMAKAGIIAHDEMASDQARIAALKERLWTGLQSVAPRRLGHPTACLAGTLNVLFPGIDAKRLLIETPRVAASLGAACTSVMPKPSHVLRAIGLDWRAAEGAVRLSLGRFTTAAEVDEAAQLLCDSYQRIYQRRAVAMTTLTQESV
jgi:cysteine desulfurase